jgi:protein-S-isoprenylcysteine O-methyltransferase Ste14
MLSGVAILRAGVREFRSFEKMSGMERGNLVTSGPYRYSRNPQVAGWLIGLLGVTLAYRSVPGLSLVAAFLFVHRLYFGIEEQHLERNFGEEYRRYKARVPRFLGLPGGD